MPANWQEKLDDGLAVLDIPAASAARDRLIAYVELLAKWNQAFNLTAVRDPAEMVTLHILDSLVVAPFLPTLVSTGSSGSLIDVGTGAGLPGIPLALLDPERPVTLLDSNIKKTRFCRQAVLALGLKNVDVVHARDEGYLPDQPFATVISRAFASLADYVAGTRHLVAAGGSLLAMKGAYPEEEVRALPEGVSVLAVHPLQVPGLDAERHLLELRLDA